MARYAGRVWRRWSGGWRAAGVCLLVALSTGTAAGAQPAFPDDFEDATGASWGEYVWPIPSVLDGCVDPFQFDNGHIEPSCLSDKTEENAARETVKAEDRWHRAGLLLTQALWTGVEFMRDILQDLENVRSEVRQLIRGTGRRLVTTVRSVRLMDAADIIIQSESRSDFLGAKTPYVVGEARYADLHTMAMRGMAVARDGQEHLSAIANNVSGILNRLSRGNTGVVRIGAGGDAVAGPGELPELPADIDSSYLDVYTMLPGLPSTAGTWRVVPTPLSARAVGGPSSLGRVRPPSVVPAAFTAVPWDAVSGGAGGAARLAAATGASASGPMGAAGAACPVDDQAAPDPVVVAERASVQLMGAQTATTATTVEVTEARDQMRGLREREETARREGFWLALLRTLHAL